MSLAISNYRLINYDKLDVVVTTDRVFFHDDITPQIHIVSSEYKYALKKKLGLCRVPNEIITSDTSIVNDFVADKPIAKKSRIMVLVGNTTFDRLYSNK